MSESPYPNGLHARIHGTRALLMDIAVRMTLPQESAHREYTRRLDVLEFEMDTGPLDIRNIYESDTDTMKFEDFKNYVYHSEHEAIAAYNKLRMQDTKTTRPTLDIIHLESSLEDILHNIDTILTNTETAQGVAQPASKLPQTGQDAGSLIHPRLTWKSTRTAKETGNCERPPEVGRALQHQLREKTLSPVKSTVSQKTKNRLNWKKHPGYHLHHQSHPQLKTLMTPRWLS